MCKRSLDMFINDDARSLNILSRQEGVTCQFYLTKQINAKSFPD
jgi:hypothetical protein